MDTQDHTYIPAHNLCAGFWRGVAENWTSRARVAFGRDRDMVRALEALPTRGAGPSGARRKQRELMKIADGSVVEIDYTLRDDDGEVIDTSAEEGPLHYLHGHGQIVPGLEKALLGRVVGDAGKVVVAPEDGYGPHHGDRVVTVPRDRLPADAEPEVGMVLEGNGPGGESILLRVVDVSGGNVTLDANHPLAGENLHFEVTVRGIRAATEEELQHGHAHGPDGHGHDHDHEHGEDCDHDH